MAHKKAEEQMDDAVADVVAWTVGGLALAFLVGLVAIAVRFL